jgi:uncharacterized protein YbaR (Trm112 family)
MAYDPPKELLEILADPETHGPVRLATEPELARLREAASAGRARRHDGKEGSTTFEAAFLCQEGAVAYVVLDGIPVFLVDERLDIEPRLELDAPIAKPA